MPTAGSPDPYRAAALATERAIADLAAAAQAFEAAGQTTVRAADPGDQGKAPPARPTSTGNRSSALAARPLPAGPTGGSPVTNCRTNDAQLLADAGRPPPGRGRAPHRPRHRDRRDAEPDRELRRQKIRPLDAQIARATPLGLRGAGQRRLLGRAQRPRAASSRHPGATPSSGTPTFTARRGRQPSQVSVTPNALPSCATIASPPASRLALSHVLPSDVRCPTSDVRRLTSDVCCSGPYTHSWMYFSLASRQNTTPKAVSGMAMIMPRIPPNAVPQKNIATMIVIGWRPVRSPMIFGVNR